MTGFPWRRLMGLGMGALGLAPAAFWAMTPRELMAALEGAGVIGAARAAPSRGALDGLMARFPDDQGGRNGGTDRGI